MTLVLLKEVLLWSIAIHYGILVVWFLVFVLAHGWLSRLHSRFFGLSVDTFNALNYAGMAVYKIGIMLFILVPWLALHLVAR